MLPYSNVGEIHGVQGEPGQQPSAPRPADLEVKTAGTCIFFKLLGLRSCL